MISKSRTEYKFGTYAVAKGNDLAISINADVNIAIANFEAVDELSDIDMSDLRSLVGVGLRNQSD